MTIEQMRNAIGQVYEGPKWRLRVRDMDNRQVVAIYKCFEAEGRLDPRHKTLRKMEPGIRKCEQLTIWDFM